MRKLWWLVVLVLCVSVAHAEYVGEALVMRPEQTVLIDTGGLPADQHVYTYQNRDPDYKDLWLAIDNGAYLYALKSMHDLPSNVIEGQTMLQDFSRYLSSQPGMPSMVEAFFQGRYEYDQVGREDQLYTPAWCFINYGKEFLDNEFGVGTVQNEVQIKRYPRWELSGQEDLKLVVLLDGKIQITSPAKASRAVYEEPPYAPPPPDYQEITEREVVSYIPSEGAEPLISFAVVVVNAFDDSYLNGEDTSLIMGPIGHVVPLMKGNCMLQIPYNNVVVSAPRYGRYTRFPKTFSMMPSQSYATDSSDGPKKLKQYLRVPIPPPGRPSFVGQRAESRNPPSGFVICDGFPRWVQKDKVVLPAYTSITITKNGVKQWDGRDDKAKANGKGVFPIYGIPTMAELDIEVGRSKVLIEENGSVEVGYRIIGPVKYDERKIQSYYVTYSWEAVSRNGALFWKMRNFQTHLLVELIREYNHHAWNGGDNENQMAAMATINGWRSQRLVRVPWNWKRPWILPHWKWVPAEWPMVGGEYLMIVNPFIKPSNPEGIIHKPVDEPPVEILR